MSAHTYDLDLTPTQQSIVTFFEQEYQHLDVIPDALYDIEEVGRYGGSGVKPFIVLWFRGLRRSSSRKATRSFAGPRLDSYESGFDAVCVASAPDHARRLLNSVTNRVVGQKFDNAGVTNVDSSLWHNTRPILDAENKPSRWAATQGFSYGVFQTRVANP